VADPLKSALALGCAGAALLAAGQVAGSVFDPPAVQVFPDHESIGRSISIRQALADGRALFAAKFNVLDGAGRPFATGDSKPTARLGEGPAFHRISGPDANSCFGCHNQPTLGGSGDVTANVFFGAQFADPPVQTVEPRFSNERNTPSLFGSGAIEILAREMSQELQRQRRNALAEARRTGGVVAAPLSASGIGFGTITAHADGYVDYSRLEGVDLDLVVRPFGVKGVAASLREFTIAALNHHHGIQAVERFGWERTGLRDFDEDGKAEEFSVGQTSALVLFQASLPAPYSSYRRHPGFAHFVKVECIECHRPVMRLESNRFTEPGGFNRPGNLSPAYTANIVSLGLPIRRDARGYYIEPFSDLRRHSICDAEQARLCNEELKQDNVPRPLFMTARLWDLNTSGPYCHRGDCATITEAILAHGGEARTSRQRFERLPDAEKRELVSFLMRLGAPE
jgi:Di-haem oxidoreductase, putative peroxidase